MICVLHVQLCSFHCGLLVNKAKDQWRNRVPQESGELAPPVKIAFRGAPRYDREGLSLLKGQGLKNTNPNEMVEEYRRQGWKAFEVDCRQGLCRAVITSGIQSLVLKGCRKGQPPRT